MEKKLQKVYLTCFNLLIAKDLWQADHEILSIIFMKGIIKFNINTSVMIKTVKLAEFLENVKDDLIEHKCLCCNKNHQQL